MAPTFVSEIEIRPTRYCTIFYIHLCLPCGGDWVCQQDVISVLDLVNLCGKAFFTEAIPENW